MAQKTFIQLTDDLDGSEAGETIPFAFRGTTYEIDLSSKNAAAMDKALGKFIEAARRTSRGPRATSTGRSRKTTAKKGSGSNIGAIRTWAHDHGYTVASRGRIPAEIQAAYAAAKG